MGSGRPSVLAEYLDAFVLALYCSCRFPILVVAISVAEEPEASPPTAVSVVLGEPQAGVSVILASRTRACAKVCCNAEAIVGRKILRFRAGAADPELVAEPWFCAIHDRDT